MLRRVTTCLAHWVRVFFRLITRRPRHDDHVDVWQGRRVDVRLKHPDPYQLDGDVVDDLPGGTLTLRSRPGR